VLEFCQDFRLFGFAAICVSFAPVCVPFFLTQMTSNGRKFSQMDE